MQTHFFFFLNTKHLAADEFMQIILYQGVVHLFTQRPVLTR